MLTIGGIDSWRANIFLATPNFSPLPIGPSRMKILVLLLVNGGRREEFRNKKQTNEI